MKSVYLLKLKVCVIEINKHSKRVRKVTLCLSFSIFLSDVIYCHKTDAIYIAVYVGKVRLHW